MSSLSVSCGRARSLAPCRRVFLPARVSTKTFLPQLRAPRMLITWADQHLLTAIQLPVAAVG